MEGNVFLRQENGDWLFDYDVVRSSEESKDTVKAYRKWANANADTVHIWMDDNLGEATGNVKGEQDNQDGKADFVRYLGDLDMAYLNGNILIHRENKHQVQADEGFIFFKTNVFEALGEVQTTVMVDVEKQREQAQANAKAQSTAAGATPSGAGTGGGGGPPG